MLLGFQAVKKYVNWNGGQLMDAFFKSPVLKTFFLGIVADFVTAPSEFPALGVPSLHLETAFDKRIPTYPGTKSAQAYWNAPGWMCAVMTNAWGWTAPGGGLGWGTSAAAEVWLSR